MSIPMNAGADAARESARQSNGEFGTQLLSEVEVSDLTASPRTVDSYAGEVNELFERWNDTEVPDTELCGDVLILGRQVRDVSEEDRPGFDMLVMRVDLQADNPANTDLADDTIFELRRITAKSNMSVVEDGQGGHTRLADSKPGVTCEDCGNGYATQTVLDLHREQDCTGHDATRDYSEDRGGYDHDDGTDDAHDELHSAAESFASDINNVGRAEQVKFLRRMGVRDAEILDAVNGGVHLDLNDERLDDLVIEAASGMASRAYNDGQTEGAKVTETLESKRWLLSGDRSLTGKFPTELAPGECTDIAITTDDGEVSFRVSYNEWVPDGDDNTPASDYRRGEFSAESEWAEHEAPVARETSPFQPARGETTQQVWHTWDQYVVALRAAAARASTKRRNDPLRAYIDGDK